MKHLTILKYLDYLSAALQLIAGVITAGTIGGSVFAAVRIAPEAAVAVVPSMILTGVIVAFLVGLSGLALVAARGIERGRGRVAQTILAVLGMSSFPIGTIFGGYAIWVCWINEETRATFDRRHLPREIAGLVLGIVVFGSPLIPLTFFAITAALPSDLDGLEAEWSALTDRTQRIPRDGCGLSEVSTDTGCAPARPVSIDTYDVTFPTRAAVMGFTSLNGTLYVPQGLAGPRPAAILVHGSGPTDRHAAAPGELIATYAAPLPLFDALAQDLAEQGLIVLTYDKRACATCYPDQYESIDFSAFRFQLFVEDALSGIDWLANRPEVDDTAIVVIGHSQGGGFAPHIQARDPRVAAVVMLAGLVTPFSEALLDQLERHAIIRERQWDLLTAWADRLQASALSSCLGRLEGDDDPTDRCLGGGVSLRAVAEYDALSQTTLDVIAAMPMPLCVINGTLDRNVPPDQLMAIRDATAGDAEFHLIGRVGHGMQDLRAPADPPTIAPAVSDALRQFLRSVKR